MGQEELPYPQSKWVALFKKQLFKKYQNNFFIKVKMSQIITLNWKLIFSELMETRGSIIIMSPNAIKFLKEAMINYTRHI